MSRIVKTVISDGPSKAILSVYLESDGVDGELTNYVILDPYVDLIPLTPPGTPMPPGIYQMTVLQIWYSLSWFDALLTFDDINPFPSWELTRDGSNYADFRYFGGLKDRSGIDTTGKLFLTTNGFAPIGSIGTIIIEIKKN
jgi:hypothetical protein